jgi:putative ABC transport system permease protein
MGLLRLLRARLGALVHRDVVAGEIREELEFHVRMRTEEYERAGEPPRDAARHARHRVGNLAVLQDRGYDVRGGGVMETILQDVRYGVRLLWTQRGFSLVAVLTLALGIGVSTALFSVIDAAMLHPLPYPHPEQLVEVTIESPQRDGRRLELDPSIDDVRVMLASPRVFSDLAVWRSSQPSLVDGPDPERLRSNLISEGYLGLYGVAPVMGRGIEATDTVVGAAPVVLIGYDYWQQRYGGSRDVLGQPIRFDTGPATIIGVLPASFERSTPIWRPFVVRSPVDSMRGVGKYVYGRLRPGLSLAQATRELTATVNRQTSARAGQAVVLDSLVAGAIAQYRTTVTILSCAVALILLIACVNVAGLQLARGAMRLPELAIRAAIGAGRFRLVRQLLTESLVVALAGGAAGLCLAWWTLDALVANLPMSLPSNAPAAINLRVLGWSAALSIGTGLIFGLAPALRLSRVRVVGTLTAGRQPGSALSRRNGQLLIAAEVALAVVLLTAAGLMVRSFGRMLAVDLGFKPDAIVTLEAQTVDPSPATVGPYYPALLDLIRRLPGVAAAGAIDHLPLGGTSLFISARGAAEVTVRVRQVLPGYFEAIALPLRSGRLPTETDRTSSRAIMVVNDAAASRLFPDGSPLGRGVVLQGSHVTGEVIGVVGDVRFNGPLLPTAPEVYQVIRPVADPSLPITRALVVVVRPSGDSRALPAELRQAAVAVGPRVLVGRVRNGGGWLDDEVMTPRRRTVLLGLLGGLGLLLTLVGIFGMTAYAVARRTREIGVRMALGAWPRDVVLMMVAGVAMPAGLGIVVGLVGAALATRVIASFLFETPPTDPGTFALVAVAIGAAAGLAAWIPARRAARVDPVRALRTE